MKRAIILIMCLIFVISFSLIGAGCAEENATVEESSTDVSEDEENMEEEAEVSEEVEETVTEEPVKLTLWWWGETDVPGLENYIIDSIEAYEELYPNVEIEQVLQDTSNTIPAFKAAAEAQEGPDIATIWYGVYQLEEVWAGNVVPLNDYIPEEEMEHWTGKSLSTYDGKVWASDLYGYGSVWVYNKEHFVEAGLDPEDPPGNWTELIEVCEALKSVGISPFAMGFKSPGWMTSIFSGHIVNQIGNSKETIVAAAGNKSFGDVGFDELFTIIDQFNSNDYLIENATSIVPPEALNEWRSGNATFGFTPSMKAFGWLEELGSEKMGIMPIPTIEETGNAVDWIPCVPMSLFITEWSPNKELAADFLMFLHSQERMNAMVEVLNGVTIPADDRFDIDIIDNPQRKEVFEKIIGGFQNGIWYADAVLPYAILGDGILPAGQSVISGDIEPAEAVQMVDDAAANWQELNPEAFEKYDIWASE